MKKIARNILLIIGILSFLFVIFEFYFFYQNATLPVSKIVFSKYTLALYSLLCGIFCSFHYSEGANTRQIVVFLYTFSLAMINLYIFPELKDFYNPVSFLLFDVFGLSTATCILLFISKNIYHHKEFIKLNKVIPVLSHIPSILLLIKYLIVFLNPNYTIVNNPLFYMTHLICGLLCLVSIIIFLYLITNYSRQSSMFFRYVSMGVFYSITPTLIILVKFIFSSKHAFLPFEIASMITSFYYLPTIIVLSIFQYKNEKINKLIRVILTFVGFSTIMVIILQIIYQLVDYSTFKKIAALTVILSPYIYYCIKRPVDNFLTLESKAVKQKLKKYADSIQTMTSLHQIYLSTAREIKKTMDCRFLFFYAFKDNHWYIPYTDTDEETSTNLIVQSKKIHAKKIIQIFDDNSVCFLIFINNRPSLRVFVGPKNNNDPFLPSELIFMQRYLDLMANQIVIINSMNISSELAMVSQHVHQIDKEIQLAAIIQQSFYPQNIEKFENWDIQFYCKAMAGVSGDLYDFYHRENHLNGLGIFDVSGHGISSGLVTMMVRNIIQHEFFKNIDKPLHEVVSVIDKRFKKEKNNIENFITGIILRFSDDNIQMVNAGHPYPIFYKKSEDRLYTFDEINNTHSSVIGFNYFESEFNSLEFTMESGDILYLYTDGITESQNPSHEQYGTKRLLEVISNTLYEKTENQIKNILADINKFNDSEPANDDITLIIMKKE